MVTEFTFRESIAAIAGCGHWITDHVEIWWVTPILINSEWDLSLEIKERTDPIWSELSNIIGGELPHLGGWANESIYVICFADSCGKSDKMYAIVNPNWCVKVFEIPRKSLINGLSLGMIISCRSKQCGSLLVGRYTTNHCVSTPQWVKGCPTILQSYMIDLQRVLLICILICTLIWLTSIGLYWLLLICIDCWLTNEGAKSFWDSKLSMLFKRGSWGNPKMGLVQMIRQSSSFKSWPSVVEVPWLLDIIPIGAGSEVCLRISQ